MIQYQISVPAASIQKAIQQIANLTPISLGVSFTDGSTVVSYYPPYPSGSNSGGGGGGGGNGATGATGATGPAGPTTSIQFDGGYPSSVYSTGPVFDCGGII